MKESMAAGLLLAAGWKEACDNLRSSTPGEDDEGLTLIDPMCGSGSLLLEAAMMAVDFAPGLMRIMNGVPGHQIPPVLRWKENKETLTPIWKEMLLEASQRGKSGLSWMREHEGKMEIIGNDIHGGALDLVKSSLVNARGLDRFVDLHQSDCCEWHVARKAERQKQQIWVMTNPPWGVRLSDDEHESWESLRLFLRENCPAGRTQAWVLSGNKSATKHLGLRRSQSVVLKTGEQDLRWIQYIMLERSQREAIVSNRDEGDYISARGNTEQTSQLSADRSTAKAVKQTQDQKPKRPLFEFQSAGGDQPTRSSSQRRSQPAPNSSTGVQRDNQQRPVRNSARQRDLSPPATSFLKRDDQNRLIKVRSPSSRSPYDAKDGAPKIARLPRRSSPSAADNDNWS